MLGTNISTLPTLKFDLSDHPFIKYDIFDGNINFSLRGTPIGIITQYCEHQKFHTYLNQRTTAHGILHLQLETGQTFGASELVENNQHQYNKF